MNDDELIKELAQPIIEELEKLEEQLKGESIQLPQIKLVLDPSSDPLIVNDVEITEEILRKLEKYLQEEVEMMHAPTILH